MIKCLIDNSEHKSRADMHARLKQLRLKQEDYYRTYIPRTDLLTGEPIPFKTAEQYLTQDFVDKRNLKKWVKANPDKGREWMVNWLKQRKAEKNILVAPSHTELKSLKVLSAIDCEDIGGYAGLASEAGLVVRYDLNEKLDTEELTCEILCDTREQMPLNIQGMARAALRVGDYGLPDPYDQGIFIERKSLNDFIGTLGRGLERFSRELERARGLGAYVIMLVETDLNQALSFNYLPHIKRHVKATPDHIFKGLRDVLNAYPECFQCLFVDGRPEAARLVRKLLGAGSSVKTIDLQYLYDKKAL